MTDAFDIDQRLYNLAYRWRTYADVTTRPGPAFPPDYTELGHGSGESVMITRCEACSEEIFNTSGDAAPSEWDTIRHLMNSHGYRMDGRQFDNQNREVGHA